MDHFMHLKASKDLIFEHWSDVYIVYMYMLTHIEVLVVHQCRRRRICNKKNPIQTGWQKKAKWTR